jgi:hypothetical protein
MPADNYGTVAYINGVWLTQCFTDGIDQELIMDSSGIDHVATKVTIRFTGLISRNKAQVKSSVVGRSNLSDGGTAIYQTRELGDLLEKINGARKPFAYFIDEQPHFSSWPVESYDLRTPVSGPFPRFGGGNAIEAHEWFPSIGEGGKISSNVIKVYGESSARISCTVEYTYVPCENVGNGGAAASYNRLRSSPIMSLRWWVADDIDGNTWLQTRTYSGRIKLLNRNINPHFARYVVMPPLTKGYKRMGINYSESEDGTELSFTVTDKEQFIQAPYPVTNFTGSWEVSQSIGFGGDAKSIIPTGNLSMMLQAPKNVSKRYLIGKMINLANTKLGILDNASGDLAATSEVPFRKGTVVTSMTFSEVIHENIVSCNMSVMYPHDEDFESLMWKIVDGSFGEREGQLGTGFNDGSGNGKNWSDWTHESLYDGDDLSFLPEENQDFQYDPDTSIYEIPPTVSLAGLALCGLQSPCAPNVAFNKKLVVVEPQQEGTDDNQQFDGNKEASDDSLSKLNTEQKVNNNVSQEDVNAPYMEYDITETYREVTDVSAGSFSYVDDSTQRANSGFHRQGRGRAVKDVTFSATRANKRPQIPGPYDYVEKAEKGDISIAVSDYTITNNSVNSSASGQQVVYQISGSFRGMMSRGYSKGEAIRLSTAPTLGEFGSEFPHDKTLFSKIPGENLLSFDNPLFNKQASTGEPPVTPQGDGGSEPDGAV